MTTARAPWRPFALPRATACFALLGACGEEPAASTSASVVIAGPTSATAEGPPPGAAPPLPGAGARVATASPLGSSAASAAAPAAACAPSLAHRGKLDARTSAALERCERLATGQSRLSRSCGLGDRKAKDLERLLDAVPELSEATIARARATFERGKAKGRSPRVFGLVGDSITVSRDFLGGFAQRNEKKIQLDEFTRRALGLSGEATVIDRFRPDASAARAIDPFSGFRAAKVGASANYALELADQGASPIDQLLRENNPAFAVVTFGANDAASKSGPPEQIADGFERNILAVVERLEAEGVVVILSNEMRHGDAPGVKACPGDAPQNDWRIAVATNATSARAAEIACREHLPFIDLRHALDAATNFGLGPDGVHLSSYKHGASVLDEHSLDCGYNIRSFVTLLALRRVVAALE